MRPLIALLLLTPAPPGSKIRAHSRRGSALLLVLSLAAPLILVGCLSGSEPSGGPPGAPSSPLFDGLVAAQAAETRDNEDGSRTFVFEHTGQATATGPATFYIVYHRPGEIHYVFSTDGGATWGEPVAVPMGERGAVTHMVAVAGDPGRLAFAYRATPDSRMLPDFVPGWSAWHLYATFVENATGPEPRFTTGLVTPPEDPVRRGGICWKFGPGNICPGDTNVLREFIDAAVGPAGGLHIAYSDACEPPCRMPVEREDTRLVVAIQADGPRLFEQGAPWRAAR